MADTNIYHTVNLLNLINMNRRRSFDVEFWNYLISLLQIL